MAVSPSLPTPPAVTDYTASTGVSTQAFDPTKLGNDYKAAIPELGAKALPNLGASSFEEMVGTLISTFQLAQARNNLLRVIMIEQGTILNAAKKDINPA